MTKKKVNKLDWAQIGSFAIRLVKILVWPMVLLVIFILCLDKLSHIKAIKVNFELLLDYISVLCWPIVALIALFILKPSMPNLINKIKEVGFGGASVKFEQMERKQSSENAGSNLKTTSSEADEPAISEDENIAKTLQSDSAKLAYEKVYRTIFGSQLKLLQRLRLYETGLKEKDLSDFFREYKEKSKIYEPNTYQSFMEYIQFLKSNILLIYEPESGNFQLTYAGLYFLMYLEAENLSHENKPF